MYTQKSGLVLTLQFCDLLLLELVLYAAMQYKDSLDVRAVCTNYLRLAITICVQ